MTFNIEYPFHSNRMFLMRVVWVLSFCLTIISGDVISQIKLDQPNDSAADSYNSIEYSKALLSQDRDILFFVKSFGTDEKGGIESQQIWRANWRGSALFDSPQPIPTLNNKHNNGVVGVSNDGQRIYLLGRYQGSERMWPGLSVSDNLGNPWSEPKSVKIHKLHIKSDHFDFFVTPDEKAMFISMGDSRFAELDLFLSLKLEDGSWSQPQAIEVLNMDSTSEIAPFYSPEYGCLFFASNRTGGKGDYDVYRSMKGDSWLDWSAPILLPSPINTEAFDSYFSIYKGEGSFLISNRSDSLSKLYFFENFDPFLDNSFDQLSLSRLDENDTQFDFDRFKVDYEGDIPFDSKAFLYENGNLAVDSSHIDRNGDFQFARMDREKEYTVGLAFAKLSAISSMDFNIPARGLLSFISPSRMS
jgi:hypothetical protein